MILLLAQCRQRSHDPEPTYVANPVSVAMGCGRRSDKRETLVKLTVGADENAMSFMDMKWNMSRFTKACESRLLYGGTEWHCTYVLKPEQKVQPAIQHV